MFLVVFFFCLSPVKEEEDVDQGNPMKQGHLCLPLTFVCFVVRKDYMYFLIIFAPFLFFFVGRFPFVFFFFFTPRIARIPPNHQPPQSLYCTVMRVLVKDQQWGRARSVLEVMRADGREPTAVAYGTLLCAMHVRCVYVQIYTCMDDGQHHLKPCCEDLQPTIFMFHFLFPPLDFVVCLSFCSIFLSVCLSFLFSFWFSVPSSCFLQRDLSFVFTFLGTARLCSYLVDYDNGWVYRGSVHVRQSIDQSSQLTNKTPPPPGDDLVALGNQFSHFLPFLNFLRE